MEVSHRDLSRCAWLVASIVVGCGPAGVCIHHSHYMHLTYTFWRCVHALQLAELHKLCCFAFPAEMPGHLLWVVTQRSAVLQLRPCAFAAENSAV